MATGARKLAGGSIWAYGGQLVSILLQMIYAGLTSRLLPKSVFGTYAVATLIASLIAILSVSGLGQSVARSEMLERSLLRALATLALITGTIAFALITPIANLWAAAWGNHAAVQSIALVGVSALAAPSVGLLSGLLRREGRFRTLAIDTTVGTALALAISAVLVWRLRTPWALILAPVLTQWLTYLLYMGSTAFRYTPGRVNRAALSHLSFSWRVSVANLMAYGIENIPRFAVSRALGAAQLGSWNRADVLTTNPFDRLQTAVMQTLYPEFRHGRFSEDRRKLAWSEILTVIAWITVPASFLLAGILPVLIPVVLGGRWVSVTNLAVVLALAAGFRGMAVQLSSALEAVARFRWIWSVHGILLTVQLGTSLLVFETRSVWPAIIAQIVVPATRHGLHLMLCWRRSMIDGPSLLRGYSEAFAFAVPCFGIPVLERMILVHLNVSSGMQLIPLAMTIILGGLVAFRFRNQLQVMRIAAKHGLVPARRVATHRA